MPDLALHAPRSLAEASEALGRYDGEARVIAGGTALVLMLRQGLVRPPALVRLDAVPGLDGVEVGAPTDGPSGRDPTPRPPSLKGKGGRTRTGGRPHPDPLPAGEGVGLGDGPGAPRCWG